MSGHFGQPFSGEMDRSAEDTEPEVTDVAPPPPAEEMAGTATPRAGSESEVLGQRVRGLFF